MLRFAKIKKHDIFITLLLIPLSIIGLGTVFSTTYKPSGGVSIDFQQQLIFFVVGVAIYFLLAGLDSSFINQIKVQVVLTILAIGLLIFLLVIPVDPSLPARWLRIGSFSFQPSEFDKLILILNTAVSFSDPRKVNITRAYDIRKQINLDAFRRFIKNEAFLRIVFNLSSIFLIVLLIIIQPSLGNGVIAFMLWLGLVSSFLPNPLHIALYIFSVLVGINAVVGTVSLSGFGFSDTPVTYFGVFLIPLAVGILGIWLFSTVLKSNLVVAMLALMTGIIIAAAAGFLWQNALTEYQQDRIVGFLDPEADPLAAGWQVNQAKIAIASGQLFGKGFLQGTQTNLGILPYAYTDFAYAAFSEQFGWVGASALLLIYLTLIIRLSVLAEQQTSNFGRLICIGVAALIAINTLVNVGMNLGLLPVTGAPLPFVSYGGSAVLVNLLGLGFVQMVHSERNERLISEKILFETIDGNKTYRS